MRGGQRRAAAGLLLLLLGMSLAGLVPSEAQVERGAEEGGEALLPSAAAAKPESVEDDRIVELPALNPHLRPELHLSLSLLDDGQEVLISWERGELAQNDSVAWEVLSVGGLRDWVAPRDEPVVVAEGSLIVNQTTAAEGRARIPLGSGLEVDRYLLQAWRAGARDDGVWQTMAGIEPRAVTVTRWDDPSLGDTEVRVRMTHDAPLGFNGSTFRMQVNLSDDDGWEVLDLPVGGFDHVLTIDLGANWSVRPTYLRGSDGQGWGEGRGGSGRGGATPYADDPQPWDGPPAEFHLSTGRWYLEQGWPYGAFGPSTTLEVVSDTGEVVESLNGTAAFLSWYESPDATEWHLNRSLRVRIVTGMLPEFLTYWLVSDHAVPWGEQETRHLREDRGRLPLWIDVLPEPPAGLPVRYDWSVQDEAGEAVLNGTIGPHDDGDHIELDPVASAEHAATRELLVVSTAADGSTTLVTANFSQSAYHCTINPPQQRATGRWLELYPNCGGFATDELEQRWRFVGRGDAWTTNIGRRIHVHLPTNEPASIEMEFWWRGQLLDHALIDARFDRPRGDVWVEWPCHRGPCAADNVPTTVVHWDVVDLAVAPRLRIMATNLDTGASHLVHDALLHRREGNVSLRPDALSSGAHRAEVWLNTSLGTASSEERRIEVNPAPLPTPTIRVLEVDGDVEPGEDIELRLGWLGVEPSDCAEIVVSLEPANDPPNATERWSTCKGSWHEHTQWFAWTVPETDAGSFDLVIRLEAAEGSVQAQERLTYHRTPIAFLTSAALDAPMSGCGVLVLLLLVVTAGVLWWRSGRQRLDDGG